MKKQKSKNVFVCQECGAKRPKWEGKCSECGKWNTYVEETDLPVTDNGRGWSIKTNVGDMSATSANLSESIESSHFRTPTGIGELDRVLGGGIVQGGFILLGGDPGIGKSTLLLQMSASLANNSIRVLYVSAEESVEQTLNRAHRLNLKQKDVHVASENNFHAIANLIEKLKPKVVIIDSIQTIYHPEITSAPGTVSQVRDCAGHLMAIAKNTSTTIFLIGHITKEGNIAGPKVLEHMVDCVLSFEGDTNYQFRLLRSLKNRFGAANELGVFSMSSNGMEEVTNPSEIFLEERSQSLIGSAVFASMEGSRPVLCEIQALCAPTPLAMPRRTAIGVDVNRLHMLIAVAIKHLRAEFYKNDVYINIVGGLKITETAADLAVLASLISSFNNEPINAKTCYFGEVGLTGEIRGVPLPEVRIREGLKLGFTNFYVPRSNKKHLKDLDFKSANIQFVDNLRDVFSSSSRAASRENNELDF
jgi:DNA repair protein RadA/Sms